MSEEPYLLKSSVLESLEGISHAFTTIVGGVSGSPYESLNLSIKTGDSAANVSKNIKIVSKALNIERDLLFLEQVHGDEVAIFDGKIIPEGPVIADAAITNQPGLPLVILTADCLPLLICDRVKKVVAVVHAGWRGTALSISEKTLSIMFDHFASHKEDIVVAMGACIGPCCYEIDESVAEVFRANYEGVLSESPRGKDRYMLDLAKTNLIQLENAGIPRENISSSSLCTMCRSDLFYSYRRSGLHSGRQGAIILID